MPLAAYGKQLVAESMYTKGGHFLFAALLLRKEGGSEYVVLHLLCHGIETTLKGLLLLRAYDKHMPRMKAYGHDLEALVAAIVAEFKMHPLRSNLTRELKGLSTLYKKHLLRYGSPQDIFVDAATIPSDRVLRRMVAVLRLADRHLARRGRTP